MKVARELRDFYDTAIAAGWRIEHTGSGHLQWKAPDGKGIVLTSSTPSDHRAVKNIRGDLRRAGLKV